MYEELKFREQSAQSILTLWHSYQEKMKKMKEFLDNLKSQVYDQQSVSRSEKELHEKAKQLEVSRNFFSERQL